MTMIPAAHRFSTGAGDVVTSPHTGPAHLVMADRRPVLPHGRSTVSRRSRRRSWALATLIVAAGALIGCGSALAASTPPPSYLFSIPTASG
jgi:hypothetical protein